MISILRKVVSVMLVAAVIPAFADDVTYNLNPTVSPKNLSEVEKGAKVTLDFGDVQVNNPYNVPVTATPQYDEDNGEPETLRLDVDADGVIYFNFDVTGEPGTQYKLSIAKGAITSVDGTQANMAKSWYYFVAEEGEDEAQLVLESVDPASGSKITAGTTINLFFNEEVDLEYCTDAVSIINNETGEENKAVLDWNWDTFDFANLQFIMPKGLAEGEYTVTIDEGIISGSYSGAKYGEITLNYTIVAEGETGPVEPTPVEVKNFSPAAEKVEALSNVINIGFKNQLASLSDDAIAVLTNDATDKMYIGAITILVNVEKTVKVEFDYGEDANNDKYLCVPGNYTLTIGADMIIGADGGVNDKISHTWTVTGPVSLNDIEYSSVFPEVGNTLKSLDKVVVTFPQSPALTKKADAKVTIGDNTYDFTLEDNVMTINVSPEITADGTYEVTIPEGAVYSLENGHGNEAIILTYKIDTTTALNALFNEANGASDIYNLQGVCVMGNATSADLDRLPKGLYIMNGKKLIIK